MNNPSIEVLNWLRETCEAHGITLRPEEVSAESMLQALLEKRVYEGLEDYLLNNPLVLVYAVERLVSERDDLIHRLRHTEMELCELENQTGQSIDLL